MQEAESQRKQGNIGKRRKGVQTRQAIIDAARDSLINEGIENFVLREIADKVGIQPGNLQYYFRTRRELLAAVLKPEFSRYDDIYASIPLGNKDHELPIRKLVEFLMEEIKLKSTTNIWYVVWALAPHDDEISRVMDEWYAQYMDSLKRLFLRINPDLDKRTAGHMASITTAMADGLTNQIGYSKQRKSIHTGIKKAWIETLMALMP